MNRKFYFALALPLAVLGSVAAADAGAAQDFDLPGTHAPDVADTDVPDVPEPTCVSCPSGYHCNDAGDGCDADEQPQPDPSPEPDPEPSPPAEDPVDVPA